MPQMMPMNWILMFSTINITMLLVMTLIYNNTNYHPNFQSFKKFKSMVKWTW